MLLCGAMQADMSWAVDVGPIGRRVAPAGKVIPVTSFFKES